jgi:hypothetical protein
MENMANIIFCGGKSQGVNHPAQTRRFPRYAKRNNIGFSYFDIIRDISGTIIVNQAADLTFWRRNKKSNVKLIFDANDPYLLDESRTFKRIFRGLFKFLARKHKYLELDYNDTYLKLCKVADVVVVGHYLLYEKLKENLNNVVLLPDYSIDMNIVTKEDFTFSQKDTIHIFWEGLGSSYLPFADINRIFLPFIGTYKFIFHFVTDLSFFSIGDIISKKYVFEVAKKESPDFYDSFRFYQWSEFAMNNIAIACDFAIIPLPMDFSMNYYKPENKLIHLWRMSVPTIVSAIPSYKRVMDEVKLFDYCVNDNEWRIKIIDFIENDFKRKDNGKRGNSFVSFNYSNERIDKLWMDVFNVVNNEN